MSRSGNDAIVMANSMAFPYLFTFAVVISANE